KGVEAPAGAPNILLILTDDVGFGACSTFGGPIQTPNFQRVADAGLRYNMYHTTALCSPTRAALITERNHHSVASGSGLLPNLPLGIRVTIRWCRTALVRSELCLRRMVTTRRGLARCTMCRTGCRARQVHLTCGPPVSASSIFMGSSAATATSGTRRCMRTP